MLVASILDRARAVLNDTFVVERFSDAELIRWLNEGIQTACYKKPTISTVSEDMALVPGGLQQLPVDTTALLDAYANNHVQGDTEFQGRTRPQTSPVRFLASTDYLEANVPMWSTEAQSPNVVYVVKTDADIRTFLVVPSNDGNGVLKIRRGLVPAELTADTDTFPLQDFHADSLVDYILYRAFSEDAEQDPVNGQRSEGYLVKFNEGL